MEVRGGPAVLAYPTKNGHVNLVDADHLGTLYDRAKVVDVCGAPGDSCKADWAGMMVTQPALTHIDGTPVLVTPAFVLDETHPAGVVAFDVVMEDGTPCMRRRWEYPSFDSAEAVRRFRGHPSRMTIVDVPGEGPVGWVVDPGDRGRLYGLRIDDGTPIAQTDLVGNGIRFIEPLVREGVVYVPSCETNLGPSHLEAYRISLGR